MEIGVAQRLITPAGTITFNGSGDGYFITEISGMDGSSIRNPIQSRPQTHGVLVHRFLRGAKYITVTGLVIASTPASRVSLISALINALGSILPDGTSATEGQYVWDPPGVSSRYHTVHLYETPDVVGPGSSAGGSPEGIAGPKTFTFSLISDRPHAWTYNTAYQALGAEIPNAGNTHSWPIIRVPGNADFTLMNGDGFELDWIEANSLGSGSYIEIDMLRQTMRWDGTGASAVDGLNMARSDFWSVPPGGTWVLAPGGSTYLSPDAWVG